jgi:predicted DsbA family dithiol-disulfide isomerase
MMGDVTRVPNTRLSHILLEWAHEQRPEGQHQLKELIFQAYYSKDMFLGLENLVMLASQAGYDGEAARAHLLSGKGEAEVVRKAKAAKAQGVNGIPYIKVNGRPTWSGAQDPATFAAGLRAAAK